MISLNKADSRIDMRFALDIAPHGYSLFSYHIYNQLPLATRYNLCVVFRGSEKRKINNINVRPIMNYIIYRFYGKISYFHFVSL